MASKAGLSGLALAYLSVGGILAYSGVENASTAQTLKAILSGSALPQGPQNSLLTATETADINSSWSAGAGGLGGSATGAAVAQDAQSYVGKVPYVWGGASPTDGWDCSGMDNYILGHDFGLTLPGNITGFDGSWHGPVVASYILWSGGTHVPESDIQPGDLICYPPNVHMGIAISSTQFVSAQDAAAGTGVSNIRGWIPFVVVRPNAYQSGASLSGTAKAKAAGQSGGETPPSSGKGTWYEIDPGSNSARVSELTSAQANALTKAGHLLIGPFSTEAAAQAAL